MSARRIYKVEIIAYPGGALNDNGQPREGWEPENWVAPWEYDPLDDTYQGFSWPSTRRHYLSKQAAQKRAKLLQSYGATALVHTSDPITWPEVIAEDCPLCGREDYPAAFGPEHIHWID